jgi:uncharacterized protein YjbI with pentapeptide repeats
MADPEHLEILRNGVEGWNRWRESNPEARPDLSASALSRQDLRGANLSRANLSGAT